MISSKLNHGPVIDAYFRAHMRLFLPVCVEATSIMLAKWDRKTRSIERQAVNVTNSAKLVALDIVLRCIISHDCQTRSICGKENVDLAGALQSFSQYIIARFLNPLGHSDAFFSLTANSRKFAKMKRKTNASCQELIRQRRRVMKQRERDSPSRDERHLITDQSSKHGEQYLDFVGVLLTVNDEGGSRLSDKEIQEQVDTVLFEGHHDTAAITLQWTLYFLAKHPETQEKCPQGVKQTVGKKSELSYDDLLHLNF